MSKKTIKVYDGVYYEASECACEYCGSTCEETEIRRAYASDTYICGEIECWNEYCFEWVWSGEIVEITEKEIEEEDDE